MAADKSYRTVLVEHDGGITWVTLNRPEKRNAMNPMMHQEMVDVLADLETDDDTRVLVLTGAGPSWCAGQDLKESVRDVRTPAARRRTSWNSHEWRWRRLHTFPKPTIAMVNGYCLGGAITALVACDLAIAAEEAIFGLSAINWGVLPGGLASRALAEAVGYRDALYYVLTGDPFDGRQAERIHLVNRAVPLSRLREETLDLARKLLAKDPRALAAAKAAYKHGKNMDYAAAEDYLAAKAGALRHTGR